MASESLEIPISSYIEILDANWSNKEINEVAEANEWIPAYSDLGKSKLSFQGNWYRLKIGDWLQNKNNDWVMVHPLSAGFKLYRNQNDSFNVSEHGYKSSTEDRIYYRRTAVSLNSLKDGEVLYFKVIGKPARSSDHPYLTTSTHFITHVSKEFPFSIFYYSVILVVSAIALFAFFILNEKIFLFYSLYMLSNIGVFLGIQGYVYQYTTLWNPGITIFFFGIVNFFIIIFMKELFKINSKAQKIIALVLAVASFVFSIFSLLGHAAMAFDGLYTVVIGTQLAIVGLCLFYSFKQKKDRWLLSTIALSFLVSSLGLINDKIWVPYTDLIDQAFQPASLLEIILFAFVLLRRFYYIILEKKEAEELAQEKTLETLKLSAEKEKLRADAEIGAIASQTAHDLASPISSLNMLLNQIDILSEDKRILMRHSINRINDIIQSLSLKGTKTRDLEKPKDQLEVTLLASLVSSIVSEKRLQLRTNGNVKLNAYFENAYSLFAKVNPIELKRVFSNSINNSVEAFGEKSGVIDVTLCDEGEHVVITIKDNGCGIPPNILAKLGQRGVTHGKDGSIQSGSGLGVYHARSTIESFGGEYKIESTENKGTTIIIKLKKETPPKWFVQELALTEGQTIIATDDDPSVLEIWKQRLASNVASNKINLYTCKSGQCLKDWIANNSDEASNAIYLIDYEFIQQKFTGLDLVEELNIKDQAILVSSRYEEPLIAERCRKLGVRAIPKSMAGFVPIVFNSKSAKLDAVLIDDDPLVNRPKNTTNSIPDAPVTRIRYDLCLLDDDRDLIQAIWGSVAKSNGLNIKMFTTPDEFFSSADTIDKLTPIYVDVSLGHGVKGTDVAKEIHNLGFTEINLATGYEADSIDAPPFIRKICGKDFPLATS